LPSRREDIAAAPDSGIGRLLRSAGYCALLLALVCLASLALASEPVRYPFQIEPGPLPAALLAFSRQSDTPIVFSDRSVRHLSAPAVIGDLTAAEALDQLLRHSGLSWEAVDERIIAVFRTRCIDHEDDPDCPGFRETGARYMAYEPGIEETYVYGSRLTGSRIRRDPGRYDAPVDIFARADIERSGAQTLSDLLRFLPAAVGNSTSTAISNGGDGTATVTLRGLPASNTLILINGRRVANAGLAGESVNLNSISAAAVERVEVLKDGASAIYGSDAIAGVVNVIMKRDFYGWLAEAYHGQSSRGDLQTRTQTLQYGGTIPRGTVFVSASHFEQEPLFSRDRRVSRNADTRDLGGSDQRSSATPNARIALPDGSTLIATPDGYRPVGPDDLYNYQQDTTAVVPLRRESLYASLIHDITDQVSAELELHWLKNSARATLAPTPIFTGFEQTSLVVAADNPFNSFGIPLNDVRRRLVEFPAREQHNESEIFRASAIMEGVYADWHWDVALTRSENRARESLSNLVDAERLQRGIGPAADCLGPAIDGCQPVNLLGPAGSLGPAQVDYLRVDGSISGYSSLSSAAINLSNALLNLPAGRGDLAVGLEFRHEATAKRPDARLADTAILGAGNLQATRGERKVLELYAETRLPLWREGKSRIDLEAALRQSSYSDFGAATNPQLGLRYQITPSLVLRSGYARGFRAPSLKELHEGPSETQAFITDPCINPANVGTLPGCSTQADPTRNQFLVVKGGNPDLDAEHADTWSAGIRWNPASVPGLRLKADYFLIEQEDVVASSAQFLVNRNARDGSFAERISRDERGNLVLVQAENLNVGRRRVQGVDLGLTWTLPRQTWGQLQLQGKGAWIGEYLTQFDPSERGRDLAGTFQDEAAEGLGGIPRWKSQLGLLWHWRNWEASYQLHHVSSLRETLPDTNRRRRIDAWTIHDLQLSLLLPVREGLRVTLGVDNVLDEAAPLAASAFNDNIDARTHELRGRFWYARLSQRF